MKKKFDIAIVGAGVIGASIARELSAYRLKVILFEKEEELAFGVSKSNSGIIHPGLQNRPGTLKGRLCLEGNSLIRKISRDLGVDFKEVGELMVIFNKEELGRLMKIKENAQKLGVKGVRLVDRAWLKKNEPNLNSKVFKALYAPSAGIISPYRLVYDLSENAIRNGVIIKTSCPVKNIVKNKNLFQIVTSKGRFQAKYIINSAGLYADDIAGMLGIRDFNIRPRKGEEFILDKKKQYLTNHLIFPLPSEMSKGIIVIKTADGNPMIGPTAEDVQDKKDLSTTDEGFQKVLASARRLVPSIKGEDIIAYFAGLRPVAGDDFIIRLERKAANCITVAGMQSPGLTASLAVALMVKKILKETGLDLKRKKVFVKHRKKTIHLFSLKESQIKKLIKKDPDYGDIVCRCENVSAKEIKDAIDRGATTLDGIKFRTRAQAGRCHGGFCTTRILKMLASHTGRPVERITKKGPGSEIIKG
ncbi:MAG: NAD(P)/FAD-dependent oxidoreductase [Candidatus Omnitrophica bacterium]|nr:NAD(P)/FAD-dependent oxidoreductase [Candidatus Omnitrophota bacterium]